MIQDAVRQAMIQGAVSAQGCKFAGGPTATVYVYVTFTTTGEVKSARLEPAFNTPVAQCILSKFRALRIPPVSATDVAAKKIVKIE
jgi:hypothetical protein